MKLIHYIMNIIIKVTIQVNNKDLTLPENIGGSLDLDRLTSTDGLTIPDALDCYLICSLANDDIDELREMCNENNKKR